MSEELTAGQADRLVDALDNFLESAREYLIGAETPLPDSQAQQELETSADPESIKTAQSQGNLFMVATADLSWALIKTLRNPVQTVAPWVCARGALEAGALAVWLLDLRIDSAERTLRTVAFRFAGLEQQRKFVEATGASAEPQRARIETMASEAIAAGHVVKRTGRGRIAWIGKPMPSVTNLVYDHLEGEPAYRLLSGVAHMHPWAQMQASYRQVVVEDNVHLTPSITPYSVAYLVTECAQALARALWSRSALFGSDLEDLAALLDDAFDRLSLNRRVRFWHDAPSSGQ